MILHGSLRLAMVRAFVTSFYRFCLTIKRGRIGAPETELNVVVSLLVSLMVD